ncbi:MAG TPA: ATP-dependent sacrificial sulfur transferase LarE [Gemmatimonadales bacterium]|nr:ATP-dependent sacrificial sulfur transferase LarE [Gemmatimonadales bacterium]
MTTLDALERHLADMGRVLLGYSGGVDSALLAVAGVRALGEERFLAVIGRSPSYPEAQWAAAIEVARRHAVPLLELETRELTDRRYVRNAPDRCYFCKSELWNRLGAVAAARGFDTVIDGTNADDLGEHRPGKRAGDERRIRSPFVELGWTKADVRRVSREVGLSTWDAPAAPCLSSRIRYGLEVTEERLRQVELGEAFLRALGARGDLRVRHHGEAARIEAAADSMPRIRDAWPLVEARFRELGFARVELDPAGYRRGGLLSLATGPA